MNDTSPHQGLERWIYLLLHFLCQVVTFVVNFLQKMVYPKSSTKIVLDSGLEVTIGEQIAEGGFSFVFEAHDRHENKYALKRIHCADEDAIHACKEETNVHRSVVHENIMPLLGMSILNHENNNNKVCYMLFPLVSNSLRHELNQRVFCPLEQQRPFPEVKALQLILGIMHGVAAMHEANLTHRDIKLDNVLLKSNGTPVLMDFGSVGPLTEDVSTRRLVLELVEQACQHTTLPYRPPELLEGGCRAGDAAIDFTRVDVWSLGCTLFGILFGASPFEIEFRNGKIKIVECGQLRILGNVPQPNGDLALWCSDKTFAIVEWMLTKDRQERPSLPAVMERVKERIVQLGGRVPVQIASSRHDDNHNPDGDLDDLLGNSNYV